MSTGHEPIAGHPNRTQEHVPTQAFPSPRTAHAAIRGLRWVRRLATGSGARPAAAAVVLSMLGLSACEDLGVTNAQNLPLEIARTQPPAPLVEQTVQIGPEPPPPAAEQPLQIAGQWWQASATEYTLPQQAVQPVASNAGLVFYALAWDAPPFDRLLVEAGPGAWREFLAVH